jgi:hypothetical protein
MEKNTWIDRLEKEVLQMVKEKRIVFHNMTRGKPKWIRNILRGSCLLRQVIEGGRGEEVDVSSYCMTLRERQGNGNWKRKH